MKESEIQSQIIFFLESNGFFVSRHQTQGVRMSGKMIKNRNAGFPDLTAIRDGQTFYFEIKKPGGKVSDIQAEWHKNAYAHGVTVHVVRDIEEVGEIIGFFKL